MSRLLLEKTDKQRQFGFDVAPAGSLPNAPVFDRILLAVPVNALCPLFLAHCGSLLVIRHNIMLCSLRGFCDKD